MLRESLCPHKTKKRRATFVVRLKNLVPRIGLEPTRLAALAPETSASTISPSGLQFEVQK